MKTLIFALLFVFVIGAYGQIIDPNIGFCDPTASSAACNGQPETNPISSGSEFGMWSYGSNDANAPWYLFLAVPEKTAGAAVAPTISSTSFSSITVRDAGALPPTPASEDIYSFACTAPGGPYDGCLGSNSSMKADNMFGTNPTAEGFGLEQAATGGVTPNFFEIFVYKIGVGNITGMTPYKFSASPDLVAGTFIAALAVGGKKGNIQFSTPFTTTGLVSGGGGNEGGPVPEPSTMMLLGSVLLASSVTLRKRLHRKA